MQTASAVALAPGAGAAPPRAVAPAPRSASRCATTGRSVGWTPRATRDRPAIVRAHRAANPVGAASVAGPVASPLPGRRSSSAARAILRDAPTDRLTVFAPAKINLFLRVTARRPDGYHDLASLFQVVSLGDTLELEVLPRGAPSDVLTCDTPGVPLDASNLVLKAIDRFRRRHGLSHRVRAHLVKRSPSGAGLGGGSGDAAAALWGAAALAGGELCAADPEAASELASLGADVGSDVPVFFSLGTAYCTGRGEVVQRVHAGLHPETPVLLVKPPAGLSTPAIFKALDLDGRSTADPEALLDAWTAVREGAAARAVGPELCVNDLEKPALAALPELGRLKATLERARARDRDAPCFDAVFMTGSGSTLVAIGNDQAPDGIQRDAGLFKAPVRAIEREEGAWYDETTKEHA